MGSKIVVLLGKGPVELRQSKVFAGFKEDSKDWTIVTWTFAIFCNTSMTGNNDSDGIIPIGISSGPECFFTSSHRC